MRQAPDIVAALLTDGRANALTLPCRSGGLALSAGEIRALLNLRRQPGAGTEQR